MRYITSFSGGISSLRVNNLCGNSPLGLVPFDTLDKLGVRLVEDIMQVLVKVEMKLVCE